MRFPAHDTLQCVPSEENEYPFPISKTLLLGIFWTETNNLALVGPHALQFSSILMKIHAEVSVAC